MMKHVLHIALGVSAIFIGLRIGNRVIASVKPATTTTAS